MRPPPTRASWKRSTTTGFPPPAVPPPGGYLTQLFYDRTGWQKSQVVSGEGAVAITRGYHPTVAAPGTTGYYLWAVAGPGKGDRVRIDPALARGALAGLRERAEVASAHALGGAPLLPLEVAVNGIVVRANGRVTDRLLAH